jgi:hypothetical protein
MRLEEYLQATVLKLQIVRVVERCATNIVFIFTNSSHSFHFGIECF